MELIRTVIRLLAMIGLLFTLLTGALMLATEEEVEQERVVVHVRPPVVPTVDPDIVLVLVVFNGANTEDVYLTVNGRPEPLPHWVWQNHCDIQLSKNVLDRGFNVVIKATIDNCFTEFNITSSSTRRVELTPMCGG